MKKNIIWYASYPKSGNTWFRIILENLFNKDHFDIDKIDPNFSNDRKYINKFCGFDSNLLTENEIYLLKPDINDNIAKNTKKLLFRKTHEAYLRLEDQRPILGNPEFYKAIYIVRNPLSIVASLANHLNISNNESIDLMCSENYSIGVSQKHTKYSSQNILSWKNNVNSWVNEKNIDLFIIKYEDLQSNTFKTLKNFFKFSELNVTDDEINKVIEKTTFNKLSQIEKNGEYSYKPRRMKSFFRKGKIDSWKEELNEEQINKIIKYNEETMIKFGYL